MMVVCVQCGQRIPLSEVIDEIGCEGCPVEGVQEGLFGNQGRTENRLAETERMEGGEAQ